MKGRGGREGRGKGEEGPENGGKGGEGEGRSEEAAVQISILCMRIYIHC
jgi:hypothetical protein